MVKFSDDVTQGVGENYGGQRPPKIVSHDDDQNGKGLTDKVSGQLQGRPHGHDVPAIVGVEHIGDGPGGQVRLSQDLTWLESWLS